MFNVEGIVIPEKATKRKNMYISPTADEYAVNGAFYMQTTNNCINYTHLVTPEKPYYGLTFFDSIDGDFSLSDFTGHNCEILICKFYDNSYRLKASVIDDSEVAYIEYDNFIVAVFNYSN